MHHLIRIVIVADVRFYRDGLADIIARHPRCSVLGTASNRADAVDRVRDTSPDIVLLDAAMADGLQATTEIVSCAPNAKVVAIALDETPHACSSGLRWVRRATCHGTRR